MSDRQAITKLRNSTSKYLANARFTMLWHGSYSFLALQGSLKYKQEQGTEKLHFFIQELRWLINIFKLNIRKF